MRRDQQTPSTTRCIFQLPSSKMPVTRRVYHPHVRHTLRRVASFSFSHTKRHPTKDATCRHGPEIRGSSRHLSLWEGQSYLHIFFDYQQIIQIDADYFQNGKMQRMVRMGKLEVGNSCRWYSLHFSYFFLLFLSLSFLLKSVLSVDNF